MSGTWASGWALNDVVTVGEFAKGVGCVADSTLGVAAASFDFSGLPTTYAHLLVVMYLRGDTAATTFDAKLQFNGDTGTNYDYALDAFNNATTVTSAVGLAGGDMRLSNTLLPAATAPANAFGTVTLLIPHYGNAANHKQVQWQGQGESAATVSTFFNFLGAGRWKSTAALNRFTLAAVTGNFAAGSRCSIYVMGS